MSLELFLLVYFDISGRNCVGSSLVVTFPGAIKYISTVNHHLSEDATLEGKLSQNVSKLKIRVQFASRRR